MSYSCESFMDYVYDGDEAMELFKRLDPRHSKKAYNRMRKAQTNPAALRMQAMQAKKICNKKFNESKDNDTMLYQFEDWLDKQIHAEQKKINGSEIKDKKGLKLIQNVYLEYKKKVQSLLNE